MKKSFLDKFGLLAFFFFALAVSISRAADISCFGNDRTRTNVLVQEVQLPLGLIQPADLHRERMWLLKKNVVSKVDFYITHSSAIEPASCMMVVKEKSRFAVDPLWDYSRLFGISTGLEFSLFNSRGCWDRLKLGIQIGGLQQYQLSYALPWFLGIRRLTLATKGYHHENRYLYSDDPRDFLLRETGAESSFIYAVNRFHSLGVTATREWIRMNDASFPGGEQSETIHTMRMFWQIDTRDWPVYPKQGMYAYTCFSRIFSEARLYDRFSSDFRWFEPVGNRSILAFQNKLELAQGRVPVYKRVHVGGSESVRGYNRGFLAGDNRWVASMELRFPIIYVRELSKGVHAGYAWVAFADAGTAWYEDESFQWNRVYGSVGIGIHAIWDRWVLRADYGHHGESWGFIDTGLGAKF